MADILDVIEEIKGVKNIMTGEIKRQQKVNFRKKGGFKEKLYLHWTTDSGYRTNEIRRKRKYKGSR